MKRLFKAIIFTNFFFAECLYYMFGQDRDVVNYRMEVDLFEKDKETVSFIEKKNLEFNKDGEDL